MATPSGATPSAGANDSVFTYRPGCAVYSLAWSARPDQPLRFAVGSFLETSKNKVMIVQQVNGTAEFAKRAEIEHSFPPTKVAWVPDRTGKAPDLLATTGDFLRLWEVGFNNAPTLRGLLTNQRSSTAARPDYSAPITSMDWNETDPTILGTSSIDTTCTIWNVETQQAKTQLIAHDREVFDIAFSKGVDVFASVGADGSLRSFDLRNLEHSTILYESPDNSPLVRVAWNKLDPNLLATFSMDSSRLTVLDVRVPAQSLYELNGHSAPINSFTWAPHLKHQLCTASDDGHALVWDLGNASKPVEDPLLVYRGDGPINHISWSSLQPEWMAMTYDNAVQTLRV